MINDSIQYSAQYSVGDCVRRNVIYVMNNYVNIFVLYTLIEWVVEYMQELITIYTTNVQDPVWSFVNGTIDEMNVR